MRGRVLVPLCVAANLAPVLLTGAWVLIFGVDVCLYDEFVVAEMLQKLRAGDLTLADLWRQHADHRVMFPMIALVGIAHATDFDSTAAMLASWATFVVGLVAILAAFRRQFRSRGPWLLWAIPISAIMHSLAQNESLVQAVQLTYAFPVAFACVSLSCLDRLPRATRGREGGGFGAAAGAAVVASFSSTMGLLTWPAALPLLVTRPRGDDRRIWLALWIVLGAIVWWAYFHDFVVRAEGSLLDSILVPVESARFVFTLIGNSLFFDSDAPALGGVCIAALTLVAVGFSIHDRRLTAHAFWLGLVIFSLLNALAIAHGRRPFGILQATGSRYTTYVLPGIAGVYAMLLDAMLRAPRRERVAAFGIGLAGIVFGIVITLDNAVDFARTLRPWMRERAFLLATWRDQPALPLTRQLHPDLDLLKDLAAFLERERLNVFARDDVVPALPPMAGGEVNGRITRLDGLAPAEGVTVEVEALPHLGVEGWALDAETLEPAGGVYLELDGRPLPAFYGALRTDASDQGDALRETRFERLIPTPPEGFHEITLLVISADGRSHRRGAPVRFRIRGARDDPSG